MSNLPEKTPWIFAVILGLASSPLVIEIYKHHNNIEQRSNSAPTSSLSKASSDNGQEKLKSTLNSSLPNESLEEKYTSSIRNAIQAYFDIEKKVYETQETSELDSYASGERLNNLIDAINKDKNDNFYIKTDKQDLNIKSITVSSDELARSRVSLVKTWRLYSSENNQCTKYYPQDYVLLDVILKLRNDKWLLNKIQTVEKDYAPASSCGPRSRTNTNSGESNERTTSSGG